MRKHQKKRSDRKYSFGFDVKERAKTRREKRHKKLMDKYEAKV